MQRVLLPLLWALFSTATWADGEATYNQVCAVCHAQGLAGAPKVGEPNAWRKLIKEGQIKLTADGYAGVRTMPAKGGKPELSVPEFAEAVVYMANLAGADWKTPDEAIVKKIEHRIAKREQQKK
jgi:cytochrome c5